jgi:hypothetical protein
VPEPKGNERAIHSRLEQFHGGCMPKHMRRARLCDAPGGELEQIQFLLGHISVQTTERYLDGCNQRIRSAVNDHIGIEPNP